MSIPIQQDFTPPFDPTGQVTITAAELYQLIAGATPASDKGIIIQTTDIAGVPQPPDAVTYPKWQRCFWRRVSATSVGVYAWNNVAASAPDLLKWIPINIAGIGAGSITTDMIADLAVTDAKIASVDGSKITGTLSGSAAAGLITTSTVLVGDIVGTPLANTIDTGKVTTAKIADLNVTGGKLEAGSATTGVPVTKLQCNGTGLDMLRTNAGATAMEFFTPNDLTKITTAPAASVAVAANALKLLRVNAGATAYELVSPTNTGSNIIQVAVKAATNATTSTLLPYDTTLPVVTEGSQAVSLAFTPVSATSIIRLQFTASFEAATDTDKISVALFSGSTCIQAMAAEGDDVNSPVTISLDCTVASVSTTLITFQVRFGPSVTGGGHGVAMNPQFSTAGKSFLSITEMTGSLT